MSGLPRRLHAPVLALLLFTSACAGPGPTPGGSSPAEQTPAASRTQPAWLSARVAAPAEIEAAPTDVPSMCNPCHPALGTYIDALAPIPGGFVALGFYSPVAHAEAWTTTNTRTWQRVANLPSPENSGIAAATSTLAATSGTGVLAVGWSGTSAAVWRTSDGSSWAMETLTPPSGAGASEQLTAVAVANGYYVAGGHEELADATTQATLWQSSDGISWTRAAIFGPVAGTQVTGVASLGSSLVAVGINGDNRHGTAAAWQSSDAGASWEPVSSSSFGGGRMLAVASASGVLCAVGENVDQTAAAAWVSGNGTGWAAVSDQPALDNSGLQLVMMSVASTGPGGGFVADGWRTDAGNGSVVVWRSPDCRSWTKLPQDVSFSGAGAATILAGPPLLVGGTMGWPDTHAAQVWVAQGS